MAAVSPNVVHMKKMSQSQSFWTRVAETIPTACVPLTLWGYLHVFSRKPRNACHSNENHHNSTEMLLLDWNTVWNMTTSQCYSILTMSDWPHSHHLCTANSMRVIRLVSRKPCSTRHPMTSTRMSSIALIMHKYYGKVHTEECDSVLTFMVQANSTTCPPPTLLRHLRPLPWSGATIAFAMKAWKSVIIVQTALKYSSKSTIEATFWNLYICGWKSLQLYNSRCFCQGC